NTWEFARDAPRICDTCIGVDEPIIWGNAGEMWRFLSRHEPLRHGIVRLSNPSNLAIGPWLLRDPLDDIVKVGLFLAVQEAIVAFRAAGPADVHVYERVAAIEVPFDGPRLAPQELWRRRQKVVVETIG